MNTNFFRSFDFFTGVPDSQLRALLDELMETFGVGEKHIIAANEGNCVALAAGYYLSTGKVPVVYMQNSGIGNAVNPICSLINRKVYGIPCIFVIGWRGEPGVHDEPQHIFQGEATLKLLEDMDLETFVIDKDTGENALRERMEAWKPRFARGDSVALVVRKGALTSRAKAAYQNGYDMNREEIIRRVAAVSGADVIVSTTGKASRELFEIREANGQTHERDFLTVGSMGHASSIALGIALNKPGTRVWCIDGDGALLMHMGALAVIGQAKPRNLIHVLINNAAHETVGGMPTAAAGIDCPAIARACGYPNARSVGDYAALDRALIEARDAGALSLIEAKAALGARADLGRPTSSAMENKESFMRYLRTLR